jgi:hypothetical protein
MDLCLGNFENKFGEEMTHEIELPCLLFISKFKIPNSYEILLQS